MLSRVRRAPSVPIPMSMGSSGAEYATRFLLTQNLKRVSENVAARASRPERLGPRVSGFFWCNICYARLPNTNREAGE